MMPQIQRSLLPDTATVRVPADGDWGGEHAEEAVEIRNVRFIERSAVRRTANVFEDGSQGLLIVDAVNSAGAFEIPVGSLVQLGDRVLSAVKCTPYRLYRGRVHHWEVELR